MKGLALVEAVNIEVPKWRTKNITEGVMKSQNLTEEAKWMVQYHIEVDVEYREVALWIAQYHTEVDLEGHALVEEESIEVLLIAPNIR